MLAHIADRKALRRLPEDSGDYLPVPLRFQRLDIVKPPAPAPAPRGQRVSREIMAGSIALGVQALLIAALNATPMRDVLPIVPVAMGGALFGVAWLAQFGPVDESDAAFRGTLWGIAGTILVYCAISPAWLVPATLFVQIAAGSIIAAITAAALQRGRT